MLGLEIYVENRGGIFVVVVVIVFDIFVWFLFLFLFSEEMKG